MSEPAPIFESAHNVSSLVFLLLWNKRLPSRALIPYDFTNKSIISLLVDSNDPQILIDSLHSSFYKSNIKFTMFSINYVVFEKISI